MLAPRNLGRGDRHQRRCNVAVASSWCVATCSIAGNQFLSGDQARRDFQGHFANGLPLGYGETSNVVPGELDVAFQLLWHSICRGGNLTIRQNDFAVVAIEFTTIAQRRCIALLFDLIQDSAHGLPHLSGSGNRKTGRLFQILDARCFGHWSTPRVDTPAIVEIPAFIGNAISMSKLTGRFRPGFQNVDLRSVPYVRTGQNPLEWRIERQCREETFVQCALDCQP